MAKTQKRSAARGTRRGRRAGSPPGAERTGADEEATTRKNFNLYQSKIDLAREILGTGTETETIDRALDLVILGEQLAQGTRRARNRPFNDLFGEAEALVPRSGEE